jgi:transposase-like protein
MECPACGSAAIVLGPSASGETDGFKSFWYCQDCESDGRTKADTYPTQSPICDAFEVRWAKLTPEQRRTEADQVIAGYDARNGGR